MDKVYPFHEIKRPSETPAAKQMFDLHADEIISDEQVGQLIAPLHNMIKDGIFDRPKRFSWWPQLLLMIVAVVTILIVASFARGDMRPDPAAGGLAAMPNAQTQLAGVPPEDNILPGYMILPGAYINCVMLALVNEENMNIILISALDDGVFAFTDIPDGKYRIIATLCAQTEFSVEVGQLVVAGGISKLIE